MAFRQLVKAVLVRSAAPTVAAAAARRPAALALSRAPATLLRPATAVWARSFGAQVRATAPWCV